MNLSRRFLVAGGVAASAALSLRSVSAQTSGRAAAAGGQGGYIGPQAALAAIGQGGIGYFRQRVLNQLETTAALVKALEAKNRAAIETAYIASRPAYEEIEVLAEVFPETDGWLDNRPYAYPGGESNPDFKGFHRIEALIFRDQDYDGALTYARETVELSKTLQGELNDDKRFADKKIFFTGPISLAEEIARKKISSEEETWSDQSVLIFVHNFVGCYSQVLPFLKDVAQKNQAAADAVTAIFNKSMAHLVPFQPGPGRFTPYSQVKIAERRQIVQNAYALRDALTKAGEVAGLL